MPQALGGEAYRGSISVEANEATEAIVAIYRDSLVGFLESRGVSGDDAADVVHQFLSERLIGAKPGKSLFDVYRARVTNGESDESLPKERRFAAYLLTSLRHFYVDCVRRQAKSREIPLDLDGAEVELRWFEPNTSVSDSQEYDHLFAQRFLDHLLQHTQRELLEEGRDDVWQVLDRRLVQPAVKDIEPESYRTLADQLNLLSPQDASQRLQTGIRRFQRNLRRAAESHAALEGVAGIEARTAATELVERVCFALIMHGMKMTDFAIRENLSVDTPTGESPLPKLLFARSADAVWSTDDLREMWLQLIDLPLARLFTGLQMPAEFKSDTLLSLWKHPSPPLTALADLKRYGRESARRQAAPSSLPKFRHAKDLDHLAEGPLEAEPETLPSQLGFVLYVLSVAVAKVRHNEVITKDGLPRLVQRLKAVLTSAWLDEQTRDLVVDAIRQISAELNQA